MVCMGLELGVWNKLPEEVVEATFMKVIQVHG